MPVELEACLDEQSVEYPALFVEHLLSKGDDEKLTSQMGSLNERGWCWLVAENLLYLWNFKKDDSVYTLNLIPNARPYNAQDIVVYEKTRQHLPGVVAVTSNGTVRHWTSVGSVHSDTQLNLNHETLLSLSLLHTEKTCSPIIILTTTVGSVYELTENEAKLGRFDSNLLASYTHSIGLGSKLSTMLFGNYDVKDKRALRSLLLPVKNTENGQEIIVLGPAQLTVFAEKSTQPAFTVSSESLLANLYVDYFKNRAQNSVILEKCFLLDMAEFRGGLMLLTCSTLAHKEYPTFALAFYPDINSLRSEPAWFAVFPLANPTLFQAAEDSSFIGQLSLLIPGEVKASETNYWDGIMVLHATFAQAIHPPNSLKFYEIPVNKAVFFPKDDQLNGHASDGKFAYAFFARQGLCTIRLLPKGFSTFFSKSDKNFGDVAELVKRLLSVNKKFKFHNAELTVFMEAFVDFSAKRIRNAERLISLLSDIQLCDSVHRFLEEILDDERGLVSGNLSSTHHRLRFKKLLTSQIMFFVKSLELDKPLKGSRCPTSFGSMFSKKQSGSSLICEAAERTTGALAIWEWMESNEDNLELITYTAEHYSQAKQLKEKTPADLFFKRLTAFNQLPLALVQLVEEELQKNSFTKKSKEYFALLLTVCDALCTLCNALDKERRTRSGVDEPKEAERWTNEQLAPILQELALIVLKAIDSPIDISSLQKKTAITRVRCLLFFAFSESSKPLEGNEAILILYNVGQLELARDLAERFKDFRLLIKIAHACEKEEETRRLLNGWKQKFKAEKFDAYLYKYYRSHGMNEELLEEDGRLADDFIDTCEDLRWRRHILHDEFDKAAKNLLILGTRATDNAIKENAFIFAKLSALCADNAKNLVEEADRNLKAFDNKIHTLPI